MPARQISFYLDEKSDFVYQKNKTDINSKLREKLTELLKVKK